MRSLIEVPVHSKVQREDLDAIAQQVRHQHPFGFISVRRTSDGVLVDVLDTVALKTTTVLDAIGALRH